jgi:hypothetical protein
MVDDVEENLPMHGLQSPWKKMFLGYFVETKVLNTFKSKSMQGVQLQRSQ